MDLTPRLVIVLVRLRRMSSGPRRLLWATLGSIVRRWCRPLEVTGWEHLADLNGPAVIAATHASHADTAVLLHLLGSRLPRSVAVAAAEDYFFATRLRSLAASIVVGAVPFPRCGRAGLERCAASLAAGHHVLIYPQGTRDGGDFKPGVGHLASLGVAVVPVRIEGTGAVLAKGTSRPRRAAVAVHVGAQLHAGGMDPAAFAARLQRATEDLGRVPANTRSAS